MRKEAFSLTAEKLLDAIGLISDEAVFDAKRGLFTGSASYSEKRSHAGRTFGKRIALYIAAAIIIILGSLCAAMAVNDNFREDVYAFLHIATPDIGLPTSEEPPVSGRIKYIYHYRIADAVEFEIIRLSEGFDYGQGLITISGKTPDNASFYTVKNGKLEKLDTNETRLSCSWNGMEYTVRFSWFVSDGTIHIHSMDKEPANDTGWCVSPIKGRTDKVMLTLMQGRQDEYREYMLVLDLSTQEVTDLLSDCGIDRLSGASEVKLSSDLSKALISFGEEKEIYCCDTASGSLCKISEYTGDPVEAAWFLDDETVICFAENAKGAVTCWKLFPFSNRSSILFSDLPLYSRTSGIGFIFSESGYGLKLDPDKTAHVYDFKNETWARVEGLACSGEDTFISVNAEGTRMLVSSFDHDADGLGIRQLGVIDMENETYTLLDREGYDIREETAAGWFDNDRIAITAVNNHGAQYLYLFHFG